MLHDARAVFDVLFITRSLHAKNARIVALSAEEGNGGHTHTGGSTDLWCVGSRGTVSQTVCVYDGYYLHPLHTPHRCRLL